MEERHSIKLGEAAKKVKESLPTTIFQKTLAHIRTNNVSERLNWEIHRYTRLVRRFLHG